MEASHYCYPACLSIRQAFLELLFFATGAYGGYGAFVCAFSLRFFPSGAHLILFTSSLPITYKHFLTFFCCYYR